MDGEESDEENGDDVIDVGNESDIEGEDIGISEDDGEGDEDDDAKVDGVEDDEDDEDDDADSIRDWFNDAAEECEDDEDPDVSSASICKATSLPMRLMSIVESEYTFMDDSSVDFESVRNGLEETEEEGDPFPPVHEAINSDNSQPGFCWSDECVRHFSDEFVVRSRLCYLLLYGLPSLPVRVGMDGSPGCSVAKVPYSNWSEPGWSWFSWPLPGQKMLSKESTVTFFIFRDNLLQVAYYIDEDGEVVNSSVHWSFAFTAGMPGYHRFEFLRGLVNQDMQSAFGKLNFFKDNLGNNNSLFAPVIHYVDTAAAVSDRNKAQGRLIGRRLLRHPLAALSEAGSALQGVAAAGLLSLNAASPGVNIPALPSPVEDTEGLPSPSTVSTARRRSGRFDEANEALCMARRDSEMEDIRCRLRSDKRRKEGSS